MSNANEEMEIMNLLAKNEEAVSGLYKFFSEKFNSERLFWNTLAQEELVYASWIKKLFPEAGKGELSFSRDSFDVKLIKRSIEYVITQLNSFKNRDLSFRDALSVALDIEITLPESKFFQIYETDSAKMKQLLQSLEDAFLGHRVKLEEKLEKQVV